MNRTREQAKSKLLKQVWSLRSLERAWRVVQSNARTSLSSDVKKEVDEFSENATQNLKSISSRLSAGSFRFAQAKGVPLPKKDSKGRIVKGKFRPIVLANIEARIVQRSILDALLSVPELQKFIHTDYSFGGIKKKSTSDRSAVPAAIQAVLNSIGSGSNFAMCADIEKFFTKIPKVKVSLIVANAVQDADFMKLFDQAITVELANLAELKDKASAFPTSDIGVAQGNSLSPLLGNILLYNFDQQMNDGDCSCIRYIDDFIVLAPSKRAANARMKKAKRLLSEFNMALNVEKTTCEPQSVTDSFEFLGIEFNNGFIRPSERARNNFLNSAREIFQESRKAFRSTRSGKRIEKHQSLVATLRRVDGLILGWGKHYKFCNDRELMKKLDRQASSLIREYLGEYSALIVNAAEAQRRNALGVDLLADIKLESLSWPKRLEKLQTSSIVISGDLSSDVSIASQNPRQDQL